MGLYVIDKTDKRLNDISRVNYDCFMFDMFTITEFNNIIDGKEVVLDNFIVSAKEGDAKGRQKHIFTKIRSLNNIISNNIDSELFLVFQTVSWKTLKKKIPYILIPVRIFDDGKKIIKNGDIIINPVLNDLLDLGDFKIESKFKDFHSLDSVDLANKIAAENGRLLYEMYLTHFKVNFNKVNAKSSIPYKKKALDSSLTINDNALVVLDREAESIRKLVATGTSVIVDAEKGTRKNELIVSVMQNALHRQHSVLYLNEKDITHLKEKMIETGLNNYTIDDMDSTFHKTKYKYSEPEFNEKIFRNVFRSISKYQTALNKTVKEFKVKNIIREYLLLEDYENERVKVEKIENLSNTDIHTIRRTLRRIESSIKDLKFSDPSASVLNDLELRELRENPEDFINKLHGVLDLIDRVKLELDETRRGFKINMSNDIQKVKDKFQHLSHFDVAKYPVSWRDPSLFEEAQKNFKKASNIVGRAYSLAYTLNKVYTSDVLDKNLTEQYLTLFNCEMKVENKEIDRLLEKSQTIIKELENIRNLAKDITYLSEKLSDFYDVSIDDDFFNYVQDVSQVMLSKHVKKNWFKIPKEKLGNVIDILDSNKETLVNYYDLSSLMSNYFADDIFTVEESLINNYIESLSKKNIRFNPEHKYSEEYILSKATYGFKSLSKQLKILILRDLYKWINLHNEASEMLGVLYDTLGQDFLLEDISEVNQMLKIIHRHEWQSKFLVYTKAQMTSLKDWYDLFIIKHDELKSYLEDKELSYLYSNNLLEFRENYTKFNNFLSNLYNVKDAFLSAFIVKPRVLSLKSMKQLITSITLHSKYEKDVEKVRSKYEVLYGDYFKGRDSDFKEIGSLIAEHIRLNKAFDDSDGLATAYETSSFKVIKKNLHKIKHLINQTLSLLNQLDEYFYHDISIFKVDKLKNYLRKFDDKNQLTYWMNYIGDISSLRKYYQLKIAALINTGFITTSLTEYFERALYRQLIELEYKYEDRHEVLGELPYFGELVSKLQQKNASGMFKRYMVKRIRLSSIASLIEHIGNRYDLIVIDGAEKIHVDVYRSLTRITSQTMLIFDSTEPLHIDSVVRSIDNYPRFELKNNYTLSLYNKNSDYGVVNKQNYRVDVNIDVVKYVVENIDKHDYINIVCSTNEERLTLFNDISDMMFEHCANYLEAMKKVQVILFNENHIRSSLTIILLNDKITSQSIRRILLNAKDIIFTNKVTCLNDLPIYEKLRTDDIELYDEVNDNFLLWFIKELDVEDAIFKQAINPYDLIILKDKKTYLLKIAHYSKRNSDILEDSLMMYDEAYENANKIVISIDDLFFKQESTINEIREMINDGNRE